MEGWARLTQERTSGSGWGVQVSGEAAEQTQQGEAGADVQAVPEPRGRACRGGAPAGAGKAAGPLRGAPGAPPALQCAELEAKARGGGLGTGKVVDPASGPRRP